MRLQRLRDWAPTRPDLRVFAGYLLAAAIYIAIGISVTDLLLSFWVGVAYVVIAAWAVPTFIRRVL